MKRAVYSRAKDAYQLVCPGPQVYIAPKALLPSLRPYVSCPLIAVEDVTKTPTWLWLNEAVKDGTHVVYDRVSRYYKVGSEKARRLSRLAEVSGAVSLVDIVPFCEDRKFLYMPWRYVGREILGYAHFYAFSGDHGEEVDGRIVNSLDESLLCCKISPHVAACNRLANVDRREVQVPFSADEHAEYAVRREQLFTKYRTPQPILTRLADLSHGFETRRQAVLSLCGRDTAVICNMQSYAMRYAPAQAGTYAKPPKRLAECRRIVFAEPPIITTYRRLDIEAELADGAEVIDVIGDTKVDAFLYGRVRGELDQIVSFVERLRASLQTAKCP